MVQTFRKVMLAAALVLALASCGRKETLATLSVEGDQEVEEVFSLARALDLGAGYIGTLDYQNAILQYTEIIAHNPQNKDAYAGLYAAYAALSQTEDADNILTQAQEVFEDEDAIVPQILSNAGTIYANGGGDAPYRQLSDWYLKTLGQTDSDALREIGNAWLSMEPGSVGPYAALGAYYSEQGDQEQADELARLAETNGVKLDDINATIETKTNGDYIIRMEIESIDDPVEEELTPQDDAQDVVKKVTQEVAQDAASQAVEDSGLEGEAADLAQQYAQDAIRQGLSALPGGLGF